MDDDDDDDGGGGGGGGGNDHHGHGRQSQRCETLVPLQSPYRRRQEAHLGGKRRRASFKMATARWFWLAAAAAVAFLGVINGEEEFLGRKKLYNKQYNLFLKINIFLYFRLLL